MRSVHDEEEPTQEAPWWQRAWNWIVRDSRRRTFGSEPYDATDWTRGSFTGLPITNLTAEPLEEWVPPWGRKDLEALRREHAERGCCIFDFNDQPEVVEGRYGQLGDDPNDGGYVA